MRTELKDFLYELGNYVDKTHTLKDKYETLTDEEKALVMEHAPIDQLSPMAQDKLAFEWLSAMQQSMSAQKS
ncbi:hypothetical protein WMZ97_03100 [Lentibacillus sp. N15]|uniref:hypothetical protein n=1 Tax=Lentibacillus songyuanensis TaxID=3136161 RepID=UPI0031BB4C27